MISHHQAELQEYKRGYVLQLYFNFEISAINKLKYTFGVKDFGYLKPII